MRMKAICFDMDGVLIDSEWLMAATEQAICRRHGIPVPESEWRSFKGKTNREIFGYIVERYGAGRDLDVTQLSQEKRELYLERVIGEVKPIPGALEFLERARARYKVLGLTTSNSRLVTDHVAHCFKFDSHFDVIITADDVPLGKSKPDPAPYLLTAARLGVVPAECYVIEDSDNGVLSAVGAGCEVVAITTSFDESTLRKAGAHIVASSFVELAWLL